MYKFVLQNEQLGRRELRAAPVGWDDLQYTFKRSKEYHGVTIEFTLDLDFLADGRGFIQAVYNTQGIEGFIRLSVYEHDPNTFKWVEAYTGRLNLSKLVLSSTKASTNIETGGIAQKFLNLDDVSVNLQSLTSVGGVAMAPYERETELVALHSQKLVKRYLAYGMTQETDYTLSVYDDPETSTRDSTIIFGFNDVKTNEIQAYDYATGFSPENNAFEIYPITESGPVRLEINLDSFLQIELKAGDFDRADFWYYLKFNDTVTELKHVGGSAGGGTFARRVTYAGTFNFDVNPGDTISVYGRVLASDLSGNYEFIYKVNLFPASFIKITAETQTRETTAPAMLVHEFFNRICSAITDQPSAFYSEYYGRTDSQPRAYTKDGPGSLRAVLPGFWVRNFPLAERSLYSAMKEAFSAFDAIDSLGLGIEQRDGTQVIRIEPVEYFYQRQNALTLGKVSDLKKRPATDYFFNQIEVGYEKWQAEEYGGLDEINTKRKYTAPITQIKKTLSYICKYITAGSLLELIRRDQYTDTTSKDNSNDNANFIVCLLRSAGAFVSERNQVITVTGVAAPDTVYNARITPARMLKRHEPKIKGSLLKQLNKMLSFAYGEGNYTATTQKIGETAPLAENQSTLIKQMAGPIWDAETYEFGYYLTLAQLRLIKENPYGFITFMDENGNLKKGWILEIKANKVTKKTDFTLLKVYE